MKSTMSLWAALIFGVSAIAGAAEGISVKTQDGKFESFKIVTGAGRGQLDAIKHNWGNTTVRMQSGKSMSVIDPFFYNMRYGKNSHYLNHKAVWPFMKYKLSEGNKVINLELQEPGKPFKKSVKIKMVPKSNRLFVTSSVTNTSDKKARLSSDEQYIWCPLRPSNVFFADGKKIDTTKDVEVKIAQWFTIYNQNGKFSTGVVLLPGSRNFYRTYTKGKGIDFHWARQGYVYAPKETKTQKYILVWGDGDVTKEVAALSVQANKGELNKLF